MLILASIIGYFAIGVLAASVRAYNEPEIARRLYLEEHNWRILYDNEAKPRSFGYPEVLFAYVFGWPMMWPALVVIEILRRAEDRGTAAMRARLALIEEHRKNEVEIDRIIREHAL